jgi:hypothetical protein
MRILCGFVACSESVTPLCIVLPAVASPVAPIGPPLAVEARLAPAVEGKPEEAPAAAAAPVEGVDAPTAVAANAAGAGPSKGPDAQSPPPIARRPTTLRHVPMQTRCDPLATTLKHSRV